MNLQRLYMVLPNEKVTAHKLIILLLKKLEIGHLIRNITQIGNNIELNFTDNARHYPIVNFDGDKKVLFRINSSKEGFNFLVEIDDEVLITDEHLKIYYPYLSEKNSIRTESQFQLKIPVQDRKVVLDEEFQKKIQKTLFNYQSYCENFNKSFTFMCGVYTECTNDHHLQKTSITQFLKLGKSLNLFNDKQELPSKDLVDRVINILIRNRDTLNSMNELYDLNPKSSAYSIHFEKNSSIYECNIKIKLGSFTLFDSRYIERFKYIFHPGLYTFVNYLNYTNNLDDFDLVIQKQIFRRV